MLNKLQWGSIVFHCNKADGAPYVIPDEIRASVMDALGLELGLHAMVFSPSFISRAG